MLINAERQPADQDAGDLCDPTQYAPRDRRPYWNETIAAFSNSVWLPIGTADHSAAINRAHGWASKTAANSWFSTNRISAPNPGLGNSCSIRNLFPMVIGKRIRLTDWGRQYGLDPQSTWRMLNEGRLPAHLQVERIGRLWYVILPDEAPALLTVGYARVSSHEQKPQLEPQANRLWAHAGQNGIKLDRVVSEVASGLNDRRPKLRRLLADPKVGYILVEHRDRLARFGVGLVEAMLEARGGRLLVIEGQRGRR